VKWLGWNSRMDEGSCASDGAWNLVSSNEPAFNSSRPQWLSVATDPGRANHRGSWVMSVEEFVQAPRKVKVGSARTSAA